MRNQGPQQDAKLTRAERQRAALKMRSKGAGYDDIAERLGYADRSGAWRSVQAAMGRLRTEAAQELRLLECERLDRLLEAVWKRAESGQPGAIRAALAVMERRARLLGLDKPSKLEIGRLLESEDWIRARGVLLDALQDHPEALESVIEALRGIDNE